MKEKATTPQKKKKKKKNKHANFLQAIKKLHARQGKYETASNRFNLSYHIFLKILEHVFSETGTLIFFFHFSQKKRKVISEQ